MITTIQKSGFFIIVLYTAVKTEMEQLAEKLRKQNLDRLEKLKNLHKEQRIKLMKQAETLTDADKFLEVLNSLSDVIVQPRQCLIIV